MTLDDLLRMSRRQLRATLSAGYDIDPTALDDTEYHGVALDIGVFEKLAWKKFKKVFARDGDVLWGWNAAVEQNGVDADWVDVMKAGKPKSYWPYDVLPHTAHRGHDRGLIIDYGPRAPWYDSMRFVRDPLVAVNEGSVDLLLGASYATPLGMRPLPTTWFALVRGGPLKYRL